jgi:hypothetical protein
MPSPGLKHRWQMSRPAQAVKTGAGRAERGASSLGREIGYAYLWVRSPMRFRSRPIIGYSATGPTLPLSYEFVIARCTTRIRGLRLATKDRIAGLTSPVHAHRQCGR